MRVIVTADGPAVESKHDPRFGRAAYLVRVDTETGRVDVIDNRDASNAAQGAGVQTAQRVAGADVDAVVTGRVGPKAERALRVAGLRVFLATPGCTVAEAVESVRRGELEPAWDPAAE